MEKQTLTAVQEQEILQANQVAAQLNLADIPLILMTVMSGKSSAAFFQNSLLKAQSESEKEEGEEVSVSKDAKGLIFNKQDLKEILKYVNEGLLLPTTLEDIKKEMPYENPENPTLTHSHYSKVFSAIKNHCSTWSKIETDIFKQGTDLKIFAGNFCSNGNVIIKAIDAMPICQQIIQTVETTTVELTEDDKKITAALSEILTDIKKNVNKQEENVENIIKELTTFSTTLSDDITAQVTKLNKEVAKINLPEENKKLDNELNQVEYNIKLTQQAYNKMVGYAFTGTTGLVFGPLGVISWAITGGIYGSKAEKVRKELDRLKKQRKDLQDQKKEKDNMKKKVEEMKDKTLDLEMNIENAMTGVRHLKTLWESVGQYIDSSQKELNDINNSQRLLSFKGKFTSCIESWSTVGDTTSELVQLFDETLKEIKAEKQKEEAQ